MIGKINLQNFIFSDDISRSDLIDYEQVFEKERKKIFIYRNHSFECIEKTIYPYLDYAGLKIDFEYSDYDDSLMFSNLNYEADLIIIWLDLSRYDANKSQDLALERIDTLSKNYPKKIMVAFFDGEIKTRNASIIYYNCDRWRESLGRFYIDTRLEAFSGTRMGMKAAQKISFDLGLNYFPSILQANLKCIVVDLDNTLYQGVLGEDGEFGVVLTQGHKAFQERLKKLVDNGFFLCIASKNDERDVINLFENREDFPLDLKDFSSIHAHWNDKGESIRDIEKGLNINSDSFLFIDDNIGEIVHVLEMHPNIKYIHAKDDAKCTLLALDNFPGMLKQNISDEDRIRKKDVESNSLRNKLSVSLSREDYIRSLNMTLVYSINDIKNVRRIAELSNKTNQFIFNYKRYSENEVYQYISSPLKDTVLVTVALKDSLSDSGIVSAVFLRKNSEDVTILEECFVSCRALGRGIDNEIVLGSIEIGLKELGTCFFRTHFVSGDRNKPAIDFIKKNLLKSIDENNVFIYENKNVFLNINIERNL
jgi:FkbH-like protein